MRVHLHWQQPRVPARARASPQGLGLRRRRQWAFKGGEGRGLLPMDSLRLGAVPRAWHHDGSTQLVNAGLGLGLSEAAGPLGACCRGWRRRGALAGY